MNDKHQMPELVWTPAGYVPKWLYDWTGENAECSGCGGITVRADEDGASTCCGTPTMLPIDRVWKMAIDRTSPLDVEALRVELLDWAHSMPRPYDAYDDRPVAGFMNRLSDEVAEPFARALEKNAEDAQRIAELERELEERVQELHIAREDAATADAAAGRMGRDLERAERELEHYKTGAHLRKLAERIDSNPFKLEPNGEVRLGSIERILRDYRDGNL